MPAYSLEDSPELTFPKQMAFYNFSSKRKDDSRCLSNFHMGTVQIGSSEYLSGEHGFHGEKFRRIAGRVTGEKRKRELIEYATQFLKDGEFGRSSALEAKRKGGKNGMCLSQSEQEIWDDEKMAVQTEICSYKFAHEKKIRDCLAELRGKILIHPTRVSDAKVAKCVWEGRGKMVDGKAVIIGGNVLGNLWMELRDR